MRSLIDLGQAMMGHNALALCVLICQASARAMDTIQALVYQTTGNAVSKFMVAGLSKVGYVNKNNNSELFRTSFNIV